MVPKENKNRAKTKVKKWSQNFNLGARGGVFLALYLFLTRYCSLKEKTTPQRVIFHFPTPRTVVISSSHKNAIQTSEFVVVQIFYSREQS